ncbi:hypothetical protein VTN49DRAFT_8104 [Thermomyces lanuginosus]|uniref:uncharacterized protein n=1 Tax=Thermomyces lanuginosus TaxID=5541 RepID=UPI0037421C08
MFHSQAAWREPWPWVRASPSSTPVLGMGTSVRLSVNRDGRQRAIYSLFGLVMKSIVLDFSFFVDVSDRVIDAGLAGQHYDSTSKVQRPRLPGYVAFMITTTI